MYISWFCKSIQHNKSWDLVKKITPSWCEGYCIKIVSALNFKTLGSKTWTILVRISHNYLWSPSRKHTPLQLLIYINNIYISALKVKIHLFVDNTCIFCSNKDLFQLQRNLNTSLENISNWLKANKLTLNVKKSKLLLFTFKVKIKNTKRLSTFILMIKNLHQKIC